MKAVDFIVELPDKILFIEFKDPEHPAAKTHSNSRTFSDAFKGGELDRVLALKYRDSFLYEWARDRLNKPVHYLVLMAIDSLDAAMLLSRTEALKRELPLDGPLDGRWRRRLAEGCAVLNIEAWNRSLKNLPVKRLAT